MILDTHTHTLKPGAVVNLDPGQKMLPGYRYSVAIHPWHTAEGDFDYVLALAQSPQVVAIGETGLDKLRGPSLEKQTELFVRHAHLAQQLGKPLIIHAVRTFPELIRLKRELRPSVPWIIHGFRGNATLARELLRHGFYLSYGTRNNPDAVAATPRDRRLIETDEASALPEISEHTTIDQLMHNNKNCVMENKP